MVEKELGKKIVQLELLDTKLSRTTKQLYIEDLAIRVTATRGHLQNASREN